MSKLTSADIATVETFFASPASVRLGDDIAAQSYEPKGRGYDPSTDMRLARLVIRGVPTSKSAWTKASCIVDQLVGRPGGAAHLDVVHRYGQQRNRSAVGALTPRAMAIGLELAKAAARTAMLEHEYLRCQAAKLSTFQATARVLALETKLLGRHIEVSVLEARAHAYSAVAEGLVNVDAEVEAMLDAAADALHDARARVDAFARAATAQRTTRRRSLREQLAGIERPAARAARLLSECLELQAAS